MPPSPPRRPNVIVIIMDDLCWGDLACHGNPYTRTPHLDSLHAQSTRLTRYCTGPLCSPARASLLTGRYHLRTRVLDTYCGRSMIDPAEPTIAKSLRAEGYRTGAFGKWHLGDCYPMRAMDMGFEETLMHNGGGIGQPGDHRDNYARWREDSYFDPVLHRRGIPEKCTGYCTDIFADATVDFIGRHADEPFFAYLATNAPHTPLLVADQWADPYRDMGINDTHSRLYGMVENIDFNVGKVLAALERLGLAEDTIVVYTSDHGPCGSARDRTAPPGEQDRFNAGLRGIKGTMYEGGIRVPCFWRWPGRFPAGRDVDRVTHPVDMLTTLLTACGVALPRGHVIDGLDLGGLLDATTPPADWPDRDIYMQWHRGDVPVRYRNYAVITDRYKLHRPDETGQDELYDLQADPFERTDLAAKDPALVRQMRERYERWLDEVAATRGPGTFDPPPIHLGTPHENPTVLTTQDWRLHGPEGWVQDNLRGHWEVDVSHPGPYTITVRFKGDVPAGTVHFQLDDFEIEALAPAGRTACVFENVTLRQGRGRIEAWRHTDEPFPPAFHQRFIPPTYIDIQR